VQFLRWISGGLPALFCLLGNPAGAADLVEPAGCSVESLLQGGGMVTDSHHLTTDINYRYKSKAPETLTAFGEIATDLQCDSWTFQADAAAYGFWNSGKFNNHNYDLAIWQGHLGASIFKRDENQGILGLSASRVLHHANLDVAVSPGEFELSAKDGAGYFRLGGFGEIYGNERMTFGAGAYYIDGDWLQFDKFLPDRHEKGLEAFATLKFYGSDNLAFALRGDIINSKIEGSNGVKAIKLSGYAISAEAEYKFDNSKLSLFAGARYADRDFKLQPLKYAVQDFQGFVGFRINLGGPDHASIRDRDRKGAYDNTSVFLEKLPSSAAAFERVILAGEIIQ
jgi:hypothetical protein